jgi:hypothetical protein
MYITTNVHLKRTARVKAHVRSYPHGDRYLLLSIEDESSPISGLHIFPAGPEFLDQLANECERAVREFVGDVPPLEPLAELHGGPETAL